MSTRKVSNVHDAVTFGKIAAQFCKSVNIQLCLNKDVDDYSSRPELDKCFEQATPIPGISKIHRIEPAMKGQLRHRLYSVSHLLFMRLNNQVMVKKPMVLPQSLKQPSVPVTAV